MSLLCRIFISGKGIQIFTVRRRVIVNLVVDSLLEIAKTVAQAAAVISGGLLTTSLSE